MAVYDKYTDVGERHDRELLEGAVAPSHRTAREQLKKAGIEVREIIAVRSEAILYLSPTGQVRTAWSEVREGGTVAFYCEAGMPAWPSS